MLYLLVWEILTGDLVELIRISTYQTATCCNILEDMHLHTSPHQNVNLTTDREVYLLIEILNACTFSGRNLQKRKQKA
jgi:hypothetical protein